MVLSVVQHALDVDIIIVLIKTTAARNGGALSCHSVRGLYFLTVVFAATIYYSEYKSYSSDVGVRVFVIERVRENDHL